MQNEKQNNHKEKDMQNNICVSFSFKTLRLAGKPHAAYLQAQKFDSTSVCFGKFNMSVSTELQSHQTHYYRKNTFHSPINSIN